MFPQNLNQNQFEQLVWKKSHNPTKTSAVQLSSKHPAGSS